MPRKSPILTSTPRGKHKSLREGLDLQDLLGRPAVNLDTPELQRFIAGKVILVTGAGGSIGSEICRQALRFCPRALVLVERAENALFEIDHELRERWVGARLEPLIADVTDSPRINSILGQFRPDVVFHAAAHKHVPMMENNPGEAVKNNIFGTQIVAEAAAYAGVGTFVLISSDKAVNPTSVMGASKRVAEMIVQAMNIDDRSAPPHASFAGGLRLLEGPSPEGTGENPAPTRFLAVRFGNVLASSGSVVPIFRKQIERGGPVTVTHPEMRRYFMTIPEASQLVMQAAAIGRGGEVFVLDMGAPIRILDLAERLIRAAGKIPGRDIQIQFCGMRPGEKLFEELCSPEDVTVPTSHPRIRVWELPRIDLRTVRATLEELRQVIDAPREHVISALARAVREYQPAQSASCLRIAAAA
ncbi:MAG: polysaccharide biosynthesis protein [Phycisphaerae bacterium]|nr:polysaccharide biosynthesis protein [Phycisphaerae bacterium]MDW8261069.1 nucleoside-diphosphate sugar epimerase/dehydratase [Phycisphaerales bacterium]